MAHHPQRNEAIRRCLDNGQEPAQVATDLGLAASTLRGWLRLARLERELQTIRQERDAQQQRQAQLVEELQQAASALAELRRLLDPEDQAAHRAVG